MKPTKPTNRNWAKENKPFKKACEIAGIPPTARQASKFKRGIGSAYRHHKKAQSIVDKKGTS